ncbi:MAG: DUF2330 domain-containing protein [Myxococcota bacterium]
MHSRIASAALAVTLSVAALAARRAEACGCFAPPDPTVPIVQAGERILFAVENGVVTAHIQIQYAGDAKDFGWLLPLPSVPTLKLGTEELFTQLINTTQPRYFVRTTTNDACGFRGGFAPTASAGFDSGAVNESTGGGSPLVTQSSIGPYDYAVLRADSKDEMFNWLVNNHYFIPTGTDQTVGPYIRPGGYFLALKLKSGKSAGDIQPVVLTYPSALPMIPIILTSVAANPNMGIQVWMLGEGRAIPRNYNHVVINDAQIDWLGQARNYNDVVIRAVSEAPEKHAFVTEYAGTAGVMVGQLDGPGRFGSTAELALQTGMSGFVRYLFEHGYTQPNTQGFFAPTLLPAVKNLVLASIPRPAALAARGVSEDSFLASLDYYLGEYRAQHPEDFATWEPAFDPQALAAQLQEKVVGPTLEAGAIFRKYRTLSRLYTTLSPEDMTRDPVFSFNPSLPEVSRDHTAELRIECSLFNDFNSAPATLTTEQGWVFHLSNRTAAPQVASGVPSALRIETLLEEGPAQVLTDNAQIIPRQTGSGCSATGAAPFALFAALGVLRRRRKL